MRGSPLASVSLIRGAILIGLLNSVLDEKVNLVNASDVAAARGLVVEKPRAGASVDFRTQSK